MKTILIALIILFISCQMAPKAENYKVPDCYYALDCVYRTQKSDKAPCSALLESCRDALKEMRVIERLNYCRDNKPSGMSERECRLWLNQK